MKPKAVLFDLDGTLLPMDQDAFTRGYFKLLAKKLIPHGYEPEKLVKAIWHGTAAMVRNDGSCTNEEAFWNDFANIYGPKAHADRPLFEEFYAVDFQEAKTFCGFTQAAPETVAMLKSAGIRVALATNPIFPAVATESRIRWAGLRPEDFELYTTYENIGFCKPNLDYYREILRRLHLSAEDCIMVGNDVREDMIAGQLGMKTFLLTDCVINPEDQPIEQWPHGDFAALQAFFEGETVPMLSYEAMQAKELMPCADLAARAFGDYEYFSIYVTDDKKRQRFLRALLWSEFRSNQNSAAFFTAKKDGKLAAVAMLCAPDYRKPSDGQYLRTGYLSAMFHGGVRNVNAWNEMEKQAGAPCHSLTGNTWYLSLLTVDPAFAGHGIGSGMLQDCLIPYVRQQGGTALCLFTNSRRNRLFYQKNGFTEFHAQQFSYNGKQIGSWSYTIEIR